MRVAMILGLGLLAACQAAPPPQAQVLAAVTVAAPSCVTRATRLVRGAACRHQPAECLLAYDGQTVTWTLTPALEAAVAARATTLCADAR